MVMSQKKNGLNELIVSHKLEIIKSRFRVKASKYDDGFHDPSIMLIIEDLLESGFSIKFFKKQDDAAALLKLLHAASS